MPCWGPTLAELCNHHGDLVKRKQVHVCVPCASKSEWSFPVQGSTNYCEWNYSWCQFVEIIIKWTVGSWIQGTLVPIPRRYRKWTRWYCFNFGTVLATSLVPQWQWYHPAQQLTSNSNRNRSSIYCYIFYHVHAKVKIISKRCSYFCKVFPATCLKTSMHAWLWTSTLWLSKRKYSRNSVTIFKTAQQCILMT